MNICSNTFQKVFWVILAISIVAITLLTFSAHQSNSKNDVVARKTLNKFLTTIIGDTEKVKKSIAEENTFLRSLEKNINVILGNMKKPSPNIAKPITKYEEHIRKRELDSLQPDVSDIKKLPKPDGSTMHDRWIVVTSIFGPNDDIAKLAKIPGWRLLVVGDKKTPKDWA